MRHRLHNVIHARWATTWRMIDGSAEVTCIFIVRGFRDKVQDSDTYAGATCNPGQRPVNAVAVENPDFVLCSFDASQAFVEGMRFE